MRISDWSSDVCSSDLAIRTTRHRPKLSAPRPTPDRVDVVSMHAQAATQWRQRIDAALERSLPAADEPPRRLHAAMRRARSEEHTSELQSLMRISYAVFCLKKNRYQFRSE